MGIRTRKFTIEVNQAGKIIFTDLADDENVYMKLRWSHEYLKLAIVTTNDGMKTGDVTALTTTIGIPKMGQDAKRFDFFVAANAEADSEIQYQRVRMVAKNSTDKIAPLPVKNNQSLLFYATKSGHLAGLIGLTDIVLSQYYDFEILVNRISLDKTGKLKLKLRQVNHMDLIPVGIELKLRHNQTRTHTEPIHAVRQTKAANIVSFEIDTTAIEWHQFYWDIHVIFEMNGVKIESRVQVNNVRLNAKLMWWSFGNRHYFDDGHQVYPYITNDNYLAMNYRMLGEYEQVKYRVREYLAVLLAGLTGWLFYSQRIWLMHEKYSETAQDNSFAFFKYLMKNPRKHVKPYFVIERNSPDKASLQAYGHNVLEFMSFKHLYMLVIANKIVASETKGHGYAWRVNRGPIRWRLDTKSFVFLQHGVLGLKVIDSIFKHGGANAADLFVVSSEREKEIVKRQFSYPDDEVVITGLTRWDEIPTQRQTKNQILIMPTWRKWLEEIPTGKFMQSEYFKTYEALLTSSVFADWLQEHDLRVKFYMHPKFMEHTSAFKSSEARIDVQTLYGEPLNKAISESKLVVTDYSSIAFEALYQKIPVMLFQFDRTHYLNAQGAYLDLEHELIAPVATDFNELMAELSKIVANDYQIDEQYAPEFEKAFAFVDRNNSERLADAIVNYKNKKKASWRNRVVRHFRHSYWVRMIIRKLGIWESARIIADSWRDGNGDHARYKQ